MARLKTFITSDGLTDFVVATTSRPKALAAWGVHQDLFKQGAARETDDAALKKAAEKTPEVVLERPAGGRKGPIQVPKEAPPPKPSKAKEAARLELTALKAKQEALVAEEAEAQAALAKRRAALDKEAEELTKQFEARKDELGRQLAEARLKARS
ncbi:hypothetical protein [Caulobacter sp. NIBR2454]|uniref:hypothetical protein n=1 Tax=Caulobacter sp. NIBR2454 TaxID=3015996 RepID=UPI0022B6E3CA|nr:hypothetical protein [Caulobacter sp. NIBR2454]